LELPYDSLAGKHRRHIATVRGTKKEAETELAKR